MDGAGQAYVTGLTGSADFPASLGPGYDTSYNNVGDAFVVKLDAAGAGLRYATFLGGSSGNAGYGIAVDGAGQALYHGPYLVGRLSCQPWPRATTPAYNGGGDTFVIELDAAGTALRYATFLGGSDSEDGYSIAVDSIGQAYVTGYTCLGELPGRPWLRHHLQQLFRCLRRQAGCGRYCPADTYTYRDSNTDAHADRHPYAYADQHAHPHRHADGALGKLGAG